MGVAEEEGEIAAPDVLSGVRESALEAFQIFGAEPPKLPELPET